VPLARICSALVQAVRHGFTGEERYSGPLSRLMPLGSPRGSLWPSRSKRQIFYGKEELWENLLMSPIPYSFQEQEDTRDSPRKGRHQVGHLLASVSSPPSFFIALTC
jgi:hypothetical protein